MPEFHVYILKCSDGSYYTGHTDNIEGRISQHEQGLIQSCYTFDKRPVGVVFVETFASRGEALGSERQIKGWSRRKKEALINEEFDLLKYLSMNTKKKNK